VKLKIVLFLFVLTIASCKKENIKRFSICNEIIYSSCDGSGYAAYCLFGIKWDSTNANQIQLSDSTVQTELTYSFMDSGYLFNTHSQENVVSLSFDQVINGSKQSIRDAFSEWASVAPLKFAEITNTERANIRIVIADISQGGLGYPPYPNAPCKELAGLLVIRPIANSTGDSYYYLALHEMGHILGLGHVRSDNLMNPDRYYFYKKLQQGDIQGIRAIYGKR
jgi:predicted Zn-dependent protease